MRSALEALGLEELVVIHAGRVLPVDAADSGMADGVSADAAGRAGAGLNRDFYTIRLSSLEI